MIKLTCSIFMSSNNFFLKFTQLNFIKITKKDFKKKLVKDIKDFLKNNEKKMKTKACCI